MNAAKQAAWLFCALVVLAYSGLYFASSTPISRLDDKTLSLAADTVITNLTVRRFDIAGKVVNSLQTPEVQHISNNNTHFFKSPLLILSQADQPAWEISSNYAKAIHGGEQITFIRDVVVHQNKGEYTKESTIKTEELTYFSKDKLASTQLAVSFEQPGSIVHSQGMNAYLASQRVQLLKQAHATYESKHA